jgi:hypothetical protein
MAKVKYNVKGVDRSSQSYEQPQPGLYTMEIKEANHRDKDGKNDIELILEITPDNDAFVGSRVWTYIGLGEASQWKLAELTDALGLPEAGTLDTAKLLGKKMKVKVNADSWNNEYRARAGRLAPLEGGEAAEVAAEDDPDAPGGGGGDDETPAAAAGDDEPKVINRNDVELSTDPEYYADWSDEDVFEEVENQGVELGRKKKSRANVIAALIAIVEEEAGGEGEPTAEADGDTYDDTDEWPDAAIAAEVKKRGLAVAGKRNRTTFIAALRAADATDGDAEDDPFAE